MEDLKLVVTEERMKDLELALFYGLETSPVKMVDFIAHFVVGEDDEYLKKDEAVAVVLEGRKLRDLEVIMGDLQNAMEMSAVPKE